MPLKLVEFITTESGVGWLMLSPEESFAPLNAAAAAADLRNALRDEPISAPYQIDIHDRVVACIQEKAALWSGGQAGLNRSPIIMSCLAIGLTDASLVSWR